MLEVAENDWEWSWTILDRECLKVISKAFSISVDFSLSETQNNLYVVMIPETSRGQRLLWIKVEMWSFSVEAIEYMTFGHFFPYRCSCSGLFYLQFSRYCLLIDAGVCGCVVWHRPFCLHSPENLLVSSTVVYQRCTWPSAVLHFVSDFS